MFLLSLTILLLLPYTALLLYYRYGWQQLREETYPATVTHPFLSVIVPARNEEKQIGALLDSLNRQTYPADRFEVLVVDDDSEDQTTAVVEQYPSVRLIRLREKVGNAYKKKALETGIAAAKGTHIVTTDADGTVSPAWLDQIAACFENKGAVFVAAPVNMEGNGSALALFQSLDFLVLQGITAVAASRDQLSLCNGANLAYEKKAFEAINGFTDIDQLASGDDLLLMQKFRRRFPGRLAYLFSRAATVTTRAETSWSGFFRQRIRWASKSRHYQDSRLFPVLLLVYLFNLQFLVLGIAGFWECWYWICAALLLLVKTLVEWPFVSRVAVFFGKGGLMKYFPLFQPLHILYTIGAGFFSQFGSYSWKGRKVR